MPGNVYVVGITNSGKSSLFNKFLDSDYCKHSCRDVVQRATVSRLPGTTLNVLGFPIMRARKRYMAHRIQRLLAEREMEKELAVARKEKLKREGRSRNATLIGNVGKTEFRSETALEEWVEKYASTGNTFATYSLDNLQDVDESDQVQEKAESWLTARKLVHNEEFPDSCWCYDTPGIVTDQQVTNHLNQTELRHILKRKVIHPRTYVMAPGDTMFVTGLTRIDYLQVPVGDEDRLNKLSSLCGTEFTMETEDANFASADLQLSSL
ncbi:NOA1-like protein, partial [Mya arenaria]